jgi:hypothetical protein
MREWGKDGETEGGGLGEGQNREKAMDEWKEGRRAAEGGESDTGRWDYAGMDEE